MSTSVAADAPSAIAIGQIVCVCLARRCVEYETFFTHPSVSTFDRIPFQLTDEHISYETAEKWSYDTRTGEERLCVPTNERTNERTNAARRRGIHLIVFITTSPRRRRRRSRRVASRRVTPSCPETDRTSSSRRDRAS
jgi:hypothetical protein